MKNRKLLITTACAFASVATAQVALAGDPEEFNCSQQVPAAIRQSAVDFLYHSKDAATLGCGDVNVAFLELEGKPEAASCEGVKDSCRDGKHFIQKFVARDYAGAKVHGHISVDWHYTRAGFTEYCINTVTDCN